MLDESAAPETRSLLLESPRDADDRVDRLREALLAAQFDLVSVKPFSVIIVLSGLEGSGRSEAINLLSEWMDSRHFHTHALGEYSSEELERPRMWRHWRRLPPKGEIGVFFRGWKSFEPFEDPTLTETERLRRIEEIVRFLRLVAADGNLVLGFFFHLSKKQQKKRLRKLSEDPRSAWRVTKKQWAALDSYDDSIAFRQRVVRLLSTDEAPWMPIEGTNPRDCAALMGEKLLAALTRRLASHSEPRPAPTTRARLTPESRHVLRELDLSRQLTPKESDDRLAAAQERLGLLVRGKAFRKRSLVVVLEGSDGAGKGGAIRRIKHTLDARQYTVVPIAAPTDEERAHPYLWRFWRHVPGHDRIVMFDRSWYGRVLVERVEGFARDADWIRAYDEINEFEEQLAGAGAIMIKFWLQISKEEQLARFKQRESTGFKRYKITPEDWRNREKWDEYGLAVEDMVARTNTDHAPWVLVESNDKRFARVKVLESLCARLDEELSR
jgi:polyphosphate:AMP phosphotransferase